LLAAVSVFVFAHATVGLVHAVAYNVILIGGVSTVLFNGNPLLRFDGYYVLADALELPNLGQRANRYLGYLVERYAYGSREASFPETDWRARVWFVFYGIASFLYRLFITIAIIISLGSRFFVIGVLLVIWAGTSQLVIPIGKGFSFLSSSPRLRRNRARAAAVTALAAGLVGLVFFVMPFPLRTVTEGITWPSERSEIRAGTDGFIGRLLVASGSQVEAGQPLVEAYDPFLDARVDVLQAQLRGLRRQYTAMRMTDQAEAAVLQEEAKGVISDLERARERRRELVFTSPHAGMFVAPVEQDMPGRFFKRGQLVGFVIDSGDRLTARTMVSQNDVALVRERTRGVDVIPVHWEGRSSRTRIIREVPGGAKSLPTPALGSMGGGSIPIDPRDSKGVTALDRYFEFEVALPAAEDRAFIGQRVKVRFDHGTEPIGFQVYRRFRQIFLRLFNV
jgi:putative peptide zinc metalloprotease protein